MNEDELDAQDAQKISKINSAGLINLRLHNLWVDVNNHSRKGQYASWNSDLDRLWCEMAADVNPTEKGLSEGDKIIKEFETIKKRVKQISPIINWRGGEKFKQLTMEDKKKQEIQYETLMEKEIFIRRLQNKQGKGTAYIEEDDDWE